MAENAETQVETPTETQETTAEFTPITTQDDFNNAIKARLTREREAIEKRYSDYAELKKANKELSGQLEAHTNDANTINDLQDKVSKYETDSVKTKVALEKGLPYQMASRLNGSTEEEIRKDADAIMGVIGTNKAVAPIKTGEPSQLDEHRSALKEVLEKAVKKA